MYAAILITLTYLEMMSSALTIFHLKTCSFSTNLSKCLAFMIIVEVEQHNLPRARGRLVRLPYPVYQVYNSFIPLYVSLANHEPSIMYLSISPFARNI